MTKEFPTVCRGEILARLGFFILLILAFFSIVVAQDQEPEIVFITGHYYDDLVIASLDGTTLVTDESNIYTQLHTPQWSPDADRIAFAYSKNIYIISVDGSELSQFTDYDDLVYQSIVNLSWSSDGDTIALTLYSREEGNEGYWIRLINTDSLTERDITSNDHNDGFWGLSVSPDGEFLVFTSNRDAFVPSATGLFLLDIETREISALTDIESRVRFDRFPSWSPDGEQIAFISENFDDGGWDIYTINVDGSNLKRITNQNTTPEVSNIAGTLDWSPNGDQIVFTACDLYPEGCELFIIDADGNNLIQLTHDEERGAFDPAWKPANAVQG